MNNTNIQNSQVFKESLYFKFLITLMGLPTTTKKKKKYAISAAAAAAKSLAI